MRSLAGTPNNFRINGARILAFLHRAHIEVNESPDMNVFNPSDNSGAVKKVAFNNIAILSGNKTKIAVGNPHGQLARELFIL